MRRFVYSSWLGQQQGIVLDPKVAKVQCLGLFGFGGLGSLAPMVLGYME